MLELTAQHRQKLHCVGELRARYATSRAPIRCVCGIQCSRWVAACGTPLLDLGPRWVLSRPALFLLVLLASSFGFAQVPAVPPNQDIAVRVEKRGTMIIVDV